MNPLRKLLVYLSLFIFLFSLVGCVNKIENSIEANANKSAAAGWEFSFEDFHLSESLNNTSETVGYGGASTSEEITKVPDEGKVFMLIKMIIEKKEGSERIEWSKMNLIDSEGNRYKRLYDSFLEDFGFKRMKGTPLSFGKNEGWIAFEVNKGSKDFKLQYETSMGIISLDIKK